MDSEREPILAPPGAGLPKIELVLGRLWFMLRRAAGNREAFNARFQQEREAIRKRLHSVGAESAARRVLIARLRGLEDSSRYWSAWMTLDHLRIVNGQITRIIAALTSGVAPEGVVSTAAVKPSPRVTGTVVAEYEASCDNLLAVVAAAGDLNTPLRHAHPWFGPLDAAGWHALAAGHIGIHCAQIERIVEGLTAAKP